MRALNLETLETRPLYTPPEGFNASCGLVGADGQYIYGVLMEDLSSRIYADSVSYTHLVYDRGNMPEDYGDPTDNKWVNIIQEKVKEELNIELEFMAIPRSEDTTKVQALMAAHNEPDLFYIYDVNTFLTWAGDGALADLTDYMEEDGAQVRSILGEDILSYGLIDGRQYAIPARRNDVSMLSSFIRKDWLEQLGIEIADRNGNPSMTPDELLSLIHI